MNKIVLGIRMRVLIIIKRGSMKLGIIFGLEFETFTIIIKFLIRNHFVIALEVVYMIEIVVGIRIHVLIIIKGALMKLEIIFSLDFKTFTIIVRFLIRNHFVIALDVV